MYRYSAFQTNYKGTLLNVRLPHFMCEVSEALRHYKQQLCMCTDHHNRSGKGLGGKGSSEERTQRLTERKEWVLRLDLWEPVVGKIGKKGEFGTEGEQRV